MIRGAAFLAAVFGIALAAAQGASASPAPTFVVTGHGWGHGVGMAQVGAYGYAKRGLGFAKILAHYYPGTALTRTSVPLVRVLLVSGARSVSVTSRSAFRVRDAGGTSYALDAGTHTLGPSLKLRVGASAAPKALAGPLRFVPGRLPLELGKAYRGSIQVAARSGTLQAVNVVGLEDYVRGVVSQEVDADWPVEALKAQAVASRSFAVATRKDSGSFDLYADTRSQVYAGVDAEEFSTNAAVQATEGKILTYRGEPAIALLLRLVGRQDRCDPGRVSRLETRSVSGLGSRPLRHAFAFTTPGARMCSNGCSRLCQAARAQREDPRRPHEPESLLARQLGLVHDAGWPAHTHRRRDPTDARAALDVVLGRGAGPGQARRALRVRPRVVADGSRPVGRSPQDRAARVRQVGACGAPRSGSGRDVHSNRQGAGEGRLPRRRLEGGQRTGVGSRLGLRAARPRRQHDVVGRESPADRRRSPRHDPAEHGLGVDEGRVGDARREGQLLGRSRRPAGELPRPLRAASRPPRRRLTDPSRGRRRQGGAAPGIRPERPLLLPAVYLGQIHAFEYWQQLPPLPSIKVAVIDSGIDVKHPDFQDQIYAARVSSPRVLA